MDKPEPSVGEQAYKKLCLWLGDKSLKLEKKWYVVEIVKAVLEDRVLDGVELPKISADELHAMMYYMATLPDTTREVIAKSKGAFGGRIAALQLMYQVYSASNPNLVPPRLSEYPVDGTYHRIYDDLREFGSGKI